MYDAWSIGSEKILQLTHVPQRLHLRNELLNVQTQTFETVSIEMPQIQPMSYTENALLRKVGYSDDLGLDSALSPVKQNCSCQEISCVSERTQALTCRVVRLCCAEPAR